MSKTRIVHIIKSLGRGGAEMLLPETLRHHDHSQYEFHYIYFLPWKHQMVASIAQNGGKVTCIPANSNVGIFQKISSLKKYIKENDIQLVHCHLPWAGIAGRIAAKWAGVPVVYTEHNNFSKYHSVTKLFSRLTLPLSDIVIPVSGDANEALQTIVERSKLRLVLNGVDTDLFNRNKVDTGIRQQLGISPTAKLIVAAAVFRKQKRLDLWLRVAKKLLEKDPSYQFILLGDGPEKEELLRLASELKLNDNIHFAGLQENVRPYFAAADVYLMTSDFEGLPVALLEAMSMGCAPVATEVGGIPEVIEDNRSGILCKKGDVDGIADRIVELWKYPEQLERIQAGARERIVERFSMKNMVKELESIYQEVLSK